MDKETCEHSLIYEDDGHGFNSYWICTKCKTTWSIAPWIINEPPRRVL